MGDVFVVLECPVGDSNDTRALCEQGKSDALSKAKSRRKYRRVRTRRCPLGCFLMECGSRCTNVFCQVLYGHLEELNER